MASIEVIKKIQERGLLISPEAARLDDDELMYLADIAEKKGLIVVQPISEEVKEREDQEIENLLEIEEPKGKRSFNDFVAYYNKRFEYLANLLRNRPGLEGVTSINRLRSLSREDVSIIGMVRDISTTRNGHLAIVLEDPTGVVRIYFSKNNEELFSQAKNIVLDEVIGIKGRYSRNAVLGTEIFFPSFPPRPLKKGKKEVYAVFIGDTHFGSKLFLEKEFKAFLAWINARAGSEQQKEIARKVKYVFITGDLVEGIGIYPGQEEDLRIKTIYGQYEEAYHYLSQIPKDKKIIVIPGNHDAVRIEEPQPLINKEYAEPIYRLENIYMYTNPAFIRIEKTNGFEGFNVLLYHGSSLVYYADKIEHIRAAGGQKKADEIMKLLLEKRHLAPTQGSNIFIPTPNDDYLLIKQIPDFFVTGHIHRVFAQNYKGVSIINTSCWSEKSEDQERRGLEPQPARIVVANLKSREMKILNFYMGNKSE